MTLVPDYIKKLKPYVAGKPIDEVAREMGLERIVKLASNENPVGPSDQAVAAAERELRLSHRYPDPAAKELRHDLAIRFQVDIGNVIVGAGSEGIMSNIIRTFIMDDDEIIAAANGFIGFRVLVHASGYDAHWVPMKNYKHDLPAMAGKINGQTKLIYLANPDNPTGTFFTKAEFDEFMKKVPDRVLVILDEAYFEYAKHIEEYPDSMHYRYDNVITLRTFSKVYGLAGLRVGYGFAHDELITNLMKVKLPFEPSRVAQAAAIAALEDTDHLNRVLRYNHEELEIMMKHFDEMGVQYIPSSANFITLKMGREEHASKFTEQMMMAGVILRHLKAFGWPDLVRVSIGVPDENAFFMQNLREVNRRLKYWKVEE